MHAPASSRSCGVCGRDKEKIMRGKSKKALSEESRWRSRGLKRCLLVTTFTRFSKPIYFPTTNLRETLMKAKFRKRPLPAQPAPLWIEEINSPASSPPGIGLCRGTGPPGGFERLFFCPSSPRVRFTAVSRSKSVPACRTGCALALVHPRFLPQTGSHIVRTVACLLKLWPRVSHHSVGDCPVPVNQERTQRRTPCRDERHLPLADGGGGHTPRSLSGTKTTRCWHVQLEVGFTFLRQTTSSES
jgi:hypothetical protein